MIIFKSKKRKKKTAKKYLKLEWFKDTSTQKEMEQIVKSLGLDYVDTKRVFCFRTTGSKARAYARIWAFPKIFQSVLEIGPAYVLELISEKYEKLDKVQKKKVIIHELLHIPKNFSGSLLPHRQRSRRIETEVNILFDRYKKNSE